MPVTINPSTRLRANLIDLHDGISSRSYVKHVKDLIQYIHGSSQDPSFEDLQSSFHGFLPSSTIPSTNGFVYSAIEAYNKHHHLIIRPDDVWFAVITQFSAYINAHAESFREQFVEHKGKEELKIKIAGTKDTVCYGDFTRLMCDSLNENIIDEEFRCWLQPNFTTTTYNDHTVATILIMGTLQEYFDYSLKLRCGLPSVTLLGEKSDYESILKKVNELTRFGTETSAFASLFKPVIAKFIDSFDDPLRPAVHDFWQRIFSDVTEGSGSLIYAGWITAFCFWDKNGACLYNKCRVKSTLELDGVRYHTLASEDIPPGWSKLLVEIDDNGMIYDAEMTAGSLGISCTGSGDNRDPHGAVFPDSMQPVAAWWITACRDMDAWR